MDRREVDLGRCGRGGGITSEALFGKSSEVVEGEESSLADKYSSGED